MAVSTDALVLYHVFSLHTFGLLKYIHGNLDKIKNGKKINLVSTTTTTVMVFLVCRT